MPCDYKLYPANWKSEIRPRILKRAGNCCEKCKAENGRLYCRAKVDGIPVYQDAIEGGDYWHADTGELLGEDYVGCGDVKCTVVKIVLTVSHQNHDIKDNRDENLKALCQRCHIHHDKEHHAVNAKKTRDKKKKQQSLF